MDKRFDKHFIEIETLMKCKLITEITPLTFQIDKNFRKQKIRIWISDWNINW